MKYRIVEFDPGIAPEDLLERHFDFEDRMFRELEAEDPVPLRERRREAIGDANPQRQVFRWVVIGELYWLVVALMALYVPCCIAYAVWLQRRRSTGGTS